MVSFGGGGGSKGKTSSKPVDLTPADFTALRPFISNALLSLMLTGGPAFGQATSVFPGGAPAPTTAASAISAPAPARVASSAPAVSPLMQQLQQAGLYTGAGIGNKREPAPAPAVSPAASPGVAAAVPAAGSDLNALLAQFGPQAATQTAPSDLVAPLRSEEQQLLDALMGQVDNPLFGAASDQLRTTLQGDFLRPESNPFLSAVIDAEQRRLGEAFRDVEVPALQSRFTLAGQNIQPQGSSAFDTAAAIGLRGLTNAQGDIASRLAGENFQQERTRQLQAAQLAPQVSAQEVERLTGILQQQALPRLIDQMGIDKGLEEFRRRMAVVLQALGLSAQLAAPTTGTRSIGSTSTDPTFEFGVGFSGE